MNAHDVTPRERSSYAIVSSGKEVTVLKGSLVCECNRLRPAGKGVYAFDNSNHAYSSDVGDLYQVMGGSPQQVPGLPLGMQVFAFFLSNSHDLLQNRFAKMERRLQDLT